MLLCCVQDVDEYVELFKHNQFSQDQRFDKQRLKKAKKRDASRESQV